MSGQFLDVQYRHLKSDNRVFFLFEDYANSVNTVCKVLGRIKSIAHEA